jgi:hypothetical protein
MLSMLQAMEMSDNIFTEELGKVGCLPIFGRFRETRGRRTCELRRHCFAWFLGPL